MTRYYVFDDEKMLVKSTSINGVYEIITGEHAATQVSIPYIKLQMATIDDFHKFGVNPEFHIT